MVSDMATEVEEEILTEDEVVFLSPEGVKEGTEEADAILCATVNFVASLWVTRSRHCSDEVSSSDTRSMRLAGLAFDREGCLKYKKI